MIVLVPPTGTKKPILGVLARGLYWGKFTKQNFRRDQKRKMNRMIFLLHLTDTELTLAHGLTM